jgi:signal transduction histidine kinase
MDEKRRKQLSELFVRESQRMARMFSRFYDVERLLTGEIELRHDPVEIGGVVEAAVEHVRPFADRKQIELQVSIENPGPTRGDAELLEFAVYNLMSNAVKYSPERSVIRVTAASAGGRASIEVRDQGPGISREDTAKIFERFYRTDDAETSGKPGYGLGLMFVREIARHHGGEVTVASKAGEGSAFKLIVPNK